MDTIEKYKDLPENIYDTFDQMTDEAYELFVQKQYDASFSTYEQCLDMIPEPKRDYGEASNVIEWMVENYLLIGKQDEAIKWVEQLGLYLKNKELMSDEEFLKGKVYFEAGQWDKSLQNFKIAFQKSRGRCFEEQDKKYLDFYRNPEMYASK